MTSDRNDPDNEVRGQPDGWVGTGGTHKTAYGVQWRSRPPLGGSRRDGQPTRSAAQQLWRVALGLAGLVVALAGVIAAVMLLTGQVG